ncbi:MAG: CotH kinase family protein [Bacteroidota bacterium]
MKLFFIFLCIPLFSAAAPQDDSWKVYSDSTLARVDIAIDPTTLQWIYNHVESDSEHVASVRFRNAFFDETVDSIGFRLRGNTSRNSQKKSFKISFNTFIKGKKFHGIEKLNLNGEHNDPSIIRSKLSFDLYRDMGIIASRANHARVYINGKYYGLYVSVEHIDEEFLKKNFADDSGNLWKCLYPADLQYLGNNQNTYKAIMNNSTTPAYELKTNESTGDFSQFVRLVSILNNTPENLLADSLESILDVSRVLQYFAVNTLIGSWDDYRSLMNNYYLYHNPSTGRFTIIPYDYDNTFGIDWFNVNWATADPYLYPKAVAGPRPLWEKISVNSVYRDLYTHFLHFYRDNVTSLPLWENRLSRIKDSITTAAVEDTYRTLDYGFTVDDFLNSYSDVSYFNKHVKFGLRQFVNLRNTSIVNQLNYTSAAPIVYGINMHPIHPTVTDSIIVSASCFGSSGLKKVWLQFTPESSSTVQVIPMIHTPVPGTKRVEEFDRWTGVIPSLNGKRSGSFKILILDSLDHAVLYPRMDSIRIIASTVAASSVVINEFMADNTTIADPNGQFDDWVELYNPTAQSVVLTGKYLTDKPASLTKWKFTQPDLVLDPGKYLIVWCDEEPDQPGVHAMIKLSAGGEFVGLTDGDGVSVLDSITFGPQTANISFGRYPDAAPAWGPMQPTPLASNSVILGVGRSDVVPERFSVDVFPNPFNPSTTIQCWLPSVSDIQIEISDIIGRSVWKSAALLQQPGKHAIQWNGRRNGGAQVSSGMYFLRVKINNAVQTKKLLLLK